MSLKDRLAFMGKLGFMGDRRVYVPLLVVGIYIAGFITPLLHYRSKYSADERREIDKAADSVRLRIDIEADENKLQIKRSRLEKSLVDIELEE